MIRIIIPDPEIRAGIAPGCSLVAVVGLFAVCQLPRLVLRVSILLLQISPVDHQLDEHALHLASIVASGLLLVTASSFRVVVVVVVAAVLLLLLLLLLMFFFIPLVVDVLVVLALVMLMVMVVTGE